MSPATWKFCWLLPLAAIVGCSRPSGPPRKICYPAKGELFVAGKPAAGALIALQPPGANAEEWSAGFPRAHVGADGKFAVSTYGEGDGAPAGEYTLLISWPVPNPQNEEAPATDRLGGRYNDPATSKLTAKIEAGPTELPPIRLP